MTNTADDPVDERDAAGMGRAASAPPVWPWLLLCAAVALWIDLGTFHRRHHGDSLIPILVSLQRWTLFYWEQDRYGMLVPWIVQPLRNPMTNLLAQSFFTIAAGLATFFLLARYVLRDATYPLVATVGAATFLVLAPPSFRFEYLGTAQPYGVGFALGLGGLILAEPKGGRRGPGRLASAMVLLGLAHWVNCAAILILGPLAVFRALFCDRIRWRSIPRNLRAAVGSWKGAGALARRAARSGLGTDLALLAFGFVVGMWVMGQSSYHHTTLAREAPVDWPRGWRELARNAWGALAPGRWPLALALAAGVGLMLHLLPAVRRRRPDAWRPAAALAGAAVVAWLDLGTRIWMAINGFPFLYLIPSALLLSLALATLAVAPACSALGAAFCQRLAVLAAPAMLIAAAWSYGLPSLAGVRADLDSPSGLGHPSSTGVREVDRQLGARTRDVLDAGCTHLLGSYWHVWPTVFRANLALHERGDDRTVWGITFRSTPTQELMRRVPPGSIRVCAPVDDPAATSRLWVYRLPPVVEAEQRPTLRVLRPPPSLPPE